MFDEKIKRLENIVNELESGKLSLEDSLAKYQEGMALVKECENALKSAREVVLKVNSAEEEKQ